MRISDARRVQSKTNPRMHMRGSAGGFTLIEVMAAMLLIGIVLPAVMQGVSATTRAGSAARHRTEAATLAEGKLSELMVTGAWDGKGLVGDFGTDWSAYKWRAAVDDWAGDVTGTGMQQLDVTVTWNDAGREQSVIVTGLVYVRPVPSS
jgi:general secretion pathway protein I